MEICLRSAERFPEEAADDDAMAYSRFIYSFK
jgi:hypothetical protein